MFAYVKAPQERRSEPRLPVTLTAQCQIGSRVVREVVGDLSVNGMFVHTGQAADAGTSVSAALALPYADGPRFCTLVGRVVRSEGAGLAVEFDLELNDLDREILRGFLSLWGARRTGRC